VVECFPSQADKHWFREDTFLALMRLRGVAVPQRLPDSRRRSTLARSAPALQRGAAEE
jgi:hypothetical protein